MAISPFLFLFLFLSFFPSSHSLRGYFIDCGSTSPTTLDGRTWKPDDAFVFSGINKNISDPVLDPTLSTVRSFPRALNRKFCYVVGPVFRTRRYMVRTTYYYGGVNGLDSPPVFDQIVDGTVWSVVNTTEDYDRGLTSYYEGVFEAKGKSISVCIGSNTYTDSDPFISALEVVLLGESLYNTTDFVNHGLRLVARHSFEYTGTNLRYPDDQFDRFWQPFGNNNWNVTNRTVSASGIWNLPPSKIFETELRTDKLEPLELNWPLISLPETNFTYYIALYFANDHPSSSDNSRVFSISLNGITYYRDLNATSAGHVVFASRWPLHGPTKITLTPSPQSKLGPLINGGELFHVVPLEGRTLVRDVINLERVKKSLKNPPTDWIGDPCFPQQYRWTGITCSEGSRIRVITLNLTSMDISGSLSPSIANLTALSGLWLGNNSLSGPIPDLSTLKLLEIVHLEDNNFSGEIPSSLGNLPRLQELFLYNNNLTGEVPQSLTNNERLDLRIFPGNHLLGPPPSS
ncbi:putative leucine-rich repeat receptor-like serine/threonine-protein kinase At2g14440 [Benincasa hispida]|uniref:putative leucine-rich repeat receptor-like serine/threonine-protein kinase At2g14440 n=1 Tax=Benincasa hispida TaxID=102211 RepID=UPI0019028601|nr:putative leucine-rich repeat receptor-like serine/threonine-protein kinase At2g14440 [Benincasa hispida]